MTAALQMVPSPVADDRADAAEDLLSDIWRAGQAWTAQVGGTSGLHVGATGSREYWARWSSPEGSPEGHGACIADALIELLRALGKDLGEWSKDDDSLLEPALAASVALVKAGGGQ